jgi:uncharacterized protein YndB with AHSA1/START domain
MQTTTETTIEREIAIAAKPETVWQFLVDPEKATRWMGLSALVDARPGGEYRVEVCPGETAGGVFVEVDPPHRLVWTWGWDEESTSDVPIGSTTIEVDLVAEGDGTLLRFTHSGLPNADAAKRHTHGWEHYLERLTVAARGDDPGPDPWAER